MPLRPSGQRGGRQPFSHPLELKPSLRHGRRETSSAQNSSVRSSTEGCANDEEQGREGLSPTGGGIADCGDVDHSFVRNRALVHQGAAHGVAAVAGADGVAGD